MDCPKVEGIYLLRIFLLILAMVVMAGNCWATVQPKTHAPVMKVGTINFFGRVCHNCKYSLREGYLTKVISPEDGQWDLSGVGMVAIDGVATQVDPKLKGN